MEISVHKSYSNFTTIHCVHAVMHMNSIYNLLADDSYMELIDQLATKYEDRVFAQQQQSANYETRRRATPHAEAGTG